MPVHIKQTNAEDKVCTDIHISFKGPILGSEMPAFYIDWNGISGFSWIRTCEPGCGCATRAKKRDFFLSSGASKHLAGQHYLSNSLIFWNLSLFVAFAPFSHIPPLLLYLLENSEQNIRMQCPLVCLIQHDDTINKYVYIPVCYRMAFWPLENVRICQ